MKKIFEGLHTKAIETSGLDTDHRWKKWAKFVDSVDMSHSNGYMFEGDFLKDGTCELEIGRPRLILVMTTTGSRQYQTRHYQVVLMHRNGDLATLAGLSTSEAQGPGWALRLRDPIAEKLMELAGEEGPNHLEGFKNDELVHELVRRGLITEKTAAQLLALGKLEAHMENTIDRLANL